MKNIVVQTDRKEKCLLNFSHHSLLSMAVCNTRQLFFRCNKHRDSTIQQTHILCEKYMIIEYM